MTPRETIFYRLRRFSALLLLFFAAAAIALPVTAHGAGKNVRIGLTEHMKENISTLNRRAYVDALTAVRNKWAYASYIEDLQACMDSDKEQMKFAVGVFDCDDLKSINDKYGHDKGDIYLQKASHLMCRIFQHSPVFRIGGDEFSVIFQNDAFRDREALLQEFTQAMAEVNASTENPWEQVRVSFGVSVYDPENDGAVIDVVRRADEHMYEHKRNRKTE